LSSADHKYKDILAKRDPLKFTGKTDAERGAELEAWLMPRIKALFADCGVSMGMEPGSAWTQIALVLAQRHVNGFQMEEDDRGRPLKDPHGDLQAARAVHGRLNRMKLHTAANRVATERKRSETSGAIVAKYKRTLTRLKGLTPEQIAEVLDPKQK
jgi:hypothetical protein